MLKKFILITMLFVGLSAFAADNFLNSVIVDNNNGDLSVVLRTDSYVKVKKEIESPNKVVLYIKGVMQSPNINTLYKNTSDVNGVTIQSVGNNDIKIYIDAKGISRANVVLEAPNYSPVTVVNSASDGKALWSILSVLILLIVIRSAKKQTVLKTPEDLIKEREMELYRNFQREVASMPSMNYKLKSYNKHVLKGETLRSYSKNLTKV